MEACSGAHYIARQLAALGHDVRLLPAQYVKPFLKGHKTDYRDAEAIAEAVQRPPARQCVHRVHTPSRAFTPRRCSLIFRANRLAAPRAVAPRDAIWWKEGPAKFVALSPARLPGPH